MAIGKLKNKYKAQK